MSEEKAIYKIENKINHKIYIGESNNPERRFKEHCTRSDNSTISLIHRAIKKYGSENFSFEIIGWFKDWEEKEKYYINFYRCRAPYGYNIHEGGGQPPHYKGEDSPKAIISKELSEKIIKELLNWKIPRKTIIANNHITSNILRHINEGNTWKKEGLNYPLRPPEKVLDNYRALYIQWMCCTSNLPLNSLGAIVGWGRSSAKMINQGNNHFNENLKYPIRNNSEYNKKVLSQETCIDYLHFGE